MMRSIEPFRKLEYGFVIKMSGSVGYERAGGAEKAHHSIIAVSEFSTEMSENEKNQLYSE